jgi:hypothetical protein
MSSARRLEVNKRWDVTIGFAANAAATLGLASSIATSNREHLLGIPPTSGQTALLAVACTFGVLRGIESWQASRGRRQ